jgi:nucleoid-associated protein YgaU
LLLADLTKAISAVAGRVVQLEDDVADGVEVEVVAVGIERESPIADCASALEGQVAFIAEAEFELAAVALAAAGRDRFDQRAVDPEARVVAGIRRVATAPVVQAGRKSHLA